MYGNFGNRPQTFAVFFSEQKTYELIVTIIGTYKYNNLTKWEWNNKRLNDMVA